MGKSKSPPATEPWAGEKTRPERKFALAVEELGRPSHDARKKPGVSKTAPPAAIHKTNREHRSRRRNRL